MRQAVMKSLVRYLSLGGLLLVLLGCDQSTVAPVQSGPNGTTQPAVNHPSPTLPVVSSAPSPTPPTAAPMNQVLTDPTISIYSMVVGDLVKRNDQPAYPIIYINPRLGHGQELDTDDNSPATLPGLLTELHNLPNGSGGMASVQFATFAAVTGPPEEGSVVQNGGAFLTLGEIVYSDTTGTGNTHFTPSAVSATVRGSIYQSRADAVGVIYQFALVGSAWQMQKASEEWRAQGVG